ncbi:MAG: zinc-binding dehydrogenase [Gammaproteobacteria bacterium]|nr:zinc-binding dehydrogenase [Gammaproteobacteria bacterium]
MAMPDVMTFNQAACICETYLTAYLNIFLLGELRNHQSILIHGGGGGVSTAAMHLCKHLVPDTKMIVTASSGKLDRVSQLGAHHVIDYQSQSFADEIREITGKSGVNIILDHIGGPYLDPNMRSLAVNGKLLQIGVTGGIKAELNLVVMMVKRQQIIGSVLRSRSADEKASIIARFSEQVMPFFMSQSIVPLVSDVFPLSRAADAHRAMEASQHFGKIVLEVV